MGKSKKTPLLAVGANSSGLSLKPSSPQRMSHQSSGLKVTPKGYPRGTFKGNVKANTPIKYKAPAVKNASSN